ncbi:hypothetical protein PM082_004233 [Marasmius tenuissimus]|nr:hypothetical protein PM082_004233 [Marasmius tenuissimus]
MNRKRREKKNSTILPGLESGLYQALIRTSDHSLTWRIALTFGLKGGTSKSMMRPLKLLDINCKFLTRYGLLEGMNLTSHLDFLAAQKLHKLSSSWGPTPRDVNRSVHSSSTVLNKEIQLCVFSDPLIPVEQGCKSFLSIGAPTLTTPNARFKSIDSPTPNARAKYRPEKQRSAAARSRAFPSQRSVSRRIEKRPHVLAKRSHIHYGYRQKRRKPLCWYGRLTAHRLHFYLCFDFLMASTCYGNSHHHEAYSSLCRRDGTANLFRLDASARSSVRSLFDGNDSFCRRSAAWFPNGRLAHDEHLAQQDMARGEQTNSTFVPHRQATLYVLGERHLAVRVIQDLDRFDVWGFAERGEISDCKVSVSRRCLIITTEVPSGLLEGHRIVRGANSSFRSYVIFVSRHTRHSNLWSLIICGSTVPDLSATHFITKYMYLIPVFSFAPTLYQDKLNNRHTPVPSRQNLSKATILHDSEISTEMTDFLRSLAWRNYSKSSLLRLSARPVFRSSKLLRPSLILATANPDHEVSCGRDHRKINLDSVSMNELKVTRKTPQ